MQTRFFFIAFFLILCSLLNSLILSGQSDDFETWNGIKINFDLPKRFEASIKEQIRFNDNSTSMKGILTEVGAAYSLNKYFDFGITFRHTVRIYGADRNRITLIAKQKYKSKPFTFGNRIKFQREYENGKIPVNYVRDKLSVSYKISKKLVTTFGNEWFYNIKYSGNKFNQYRLLLSLAIKLNKRNHIEAGYIYEQQFNIANPALTHIGVINYKLSLF